MIQRDTQLSGPPSLRRVRKAFVFEPGSAVIIATLSLLGPLFVLSVASEAFLLDAGITPASILLSGVLLVSAASCGRDVLHPARILALLIALAFVVGPIVHATTGVYALPDGAERQRAELPRATWIVLAGTILTMLMMRTVLGKYWGSKLPVRNRTSINRRAMMFAGGIAASGVALFAAYLALIGPGSVSLQGRGATYAVIANEGRRAYLSLLAPIGLGGLLVIAGRAIEQRSRLVLILSGGAAVTFGAVMALPGSRANLLYAAVPFFILYATHRGLPKRLWLVGASVAVILALTYGASLRSAETRSALVRDPGRTLVEAGPTADSLERFFLVDVAHTEPLLGAMDAYPATRPFLGGESAAIGFTGPAGWKFGKEIGLDIDPPAGVTLTATAYGRDPSTFGSGLTATLPGELYANAGVPGVLLGLAAFGAIAGSIRRRAILSRASGALLFYAVSLTILFAVFADYFGQVYRAGVVLFGIAIPLIAAGERRFAFTRAAVIAGLITVTAAFLLTSRALLGAPPETLLTSTVPVYIVLASTLVVLIRSLFAHIRGS